MLRTEKKVTCPACAHELSVQPDADLAHLVCPHCEVEIPEQAVRGPSEAAEDLALGFKPGQRLGNYVIEALLGSGGMGAVFRGRQLSFNRNVAIKILPKDLARNKLFIQRFAREGMVLANLNHPNIVSAIDRGCEGETYFIVMEYVEGETLSDRLCRQGKLAPDQVLVIGEQVLAGLEYAHRHGVVHRDIKPGNIMINREEQVKIADFGLAHLARAQSGLDVTRDHQTMGTLKYMAPEQLTSAKIVEERADIYSFGVCLYELITGKLPLGLFKMPTEVDSALDVRWDDIILRSLKMDPDDRFASAGEMARALRELATTPRITQAQREKDKDTTSMVRGVLSLTTCANCGHESAPTARQCEQCGASLEDIFDECPSCKMGHRLDIALCPGCGADLAHHRKQLHKAVQAIQAKARQLVSDHEFAAALLELKKLEDFRTREYASIRTNARIWIERVSLRRERHLRRTYEAGLRMAAEGDAERALQLWKALPDDYKDIVARRKELAGRADAGQVALAEGNRSYDRGDLARAVAEWQKAAAFRPLDVELKRRLTAARDRLGNLNLKRSYLREAEEEATRGNLDEAYVLCRKALDLDPSDESALLVEKELEAKQRELAESEVREAPEVRKPPEVEPAAPLSERPHLRPVLLSLAILGVIAGVLCIYFVFISRPRANAARVMEADKAFKEALSLKETGKFSDAITLCSRIAKDYSGTVYAKNADELSQGIQKLIADAHARCEEAGAIARNGDLDSLIAGFKKYQQILSGPPVTLVAESRELAAQQLEQIRDRIALAEAELGARDERNGDWRAALERYRMVAEKFAFHRDPITSKIARAQKQLNDCAVRVQAGREAFRASKWDAAYDAAVAAVSFVSADPDARSLLASIAPKLKPPPGMVLVPPGQYIVGGCEGNPRRTVELPFGLFMDIKEVTHGRFTEFLRATGRPPPPGWTEQQSSNDMPVANVTWSEAAAFAAWAGCTLPTEEQWEFACRGPSGQVYPWGETWTPANAVVGFGPTPVGAVQGDRSPFNCMDMAGNVAEWTATALESAAAGSPVSVRPGTSANPRYYVVKGSSWAGLEKERPTRVVAIPLTEGVSDMPTLLTPDSRTREWLVEYRSDIEMEYLGAVATADYRYVLVRKWMPGWDHWAESKFRVMLDQEIGGTATVTVDEGPLPRRKMITLPFSIGCLAMKEETNEWLDARDPSGVMRRLLVVNGAASRSAKVNECKDAAAAPEMTLERAVSAATRMVGRKDARYINVGFRCAKVLGPPTAPAEEVMKTVAVGPPAKMDTLTVPNGAAVTWGSILLPAIPKKPGEAITLRFRARGDFATPAGWNYMTSLKWNDVNVAPKTKYGTPRLINRSEMATYTEKGKTLSMPAWSGGALLLLYGPADQLDARVTWQRDEGYWYVLDITDLVRSDGPNKLSASNNATLKALDGKSLNVVLDSISLEHVAEAVVKARLAAHKK
jgi:formylglycine-generating enzyme required for sulfatase activity/tRNA A-37 threonylcarbamoyl transferase component Bud32